MSTSYEPYIIEAPDSDTEFEDWTLAKVDPFSDGTGWSVTSDDHSGCVVPHLPITQYGQTLREAIEPKVGDTLRVWGRWGSEMAGQALNGVVLWYRTPAQREARRRRWLEDHAAEQQRAFTASVPKLDAQFEALSAPFKARIQRFRDADPEFRVMDESYEAGICQQADLLVAHFGDAGKVRAWEALGTKEHDYDMAEQRRQAPPGWSDGHSGWSHGAAVGLACAVLEGQAV